MNAAALSGSDYNGISGILTFAPGITTLAVSVPILPDKVAESDEQFKFNISNAVGAIIADSQGGPKIVNDDGAVSAALSAPASPDDMAVENNSPSAPSARNPEVRKAPRLARLGSTRN